MSEIIAHRPRANEKAKYHSGWDNQLLGNRGFIGLHTPAGYLLIMIGFLLVGLIVIAGGLTARMIEKDNVEKRKAMRRNKKE